MFEILRKLQFPTNIEGFSFTEYLTVFLGLIFALAVGEFFISIGSILRNRQKFTFYWEFYLWIFVLLDLFILTWYVYWIRLPYVEKGLTYFYLFTIPNLIIFLIVAIYFPAINGDQTINLKDHFLSRIRLFFGLFTFYLMFDLVTEIAIHPEISSLVLWGHIIYISLGTMNAAFPRVWLRMILVTLFSLHITALLVLV